MDEHTHHRSLDGTGQICFEHSGICKDISSVKEEIIRNDETNTRNHEAQWKAMEVLRDNTAALKDAISSILIKIGFITGAAAVVNIVVVIYFTRTH